MEIKINKIYPMVRGLEKYVKLIALPLSLDTLSYGRLAESIDIILVKIHYPCLIHQWPVVGSEWLVAKSVATINGSHYLQFLLCIGFHVNGM